MSDPSEYPTGLAAALSLTAQRFVFERQRPFAGSPFALFFRQNVATMGRELAAPRPEKLMVRASVGAQGWASVPWLAFFAPHVTRSMRHGLYVVIFINAHDERITLSLQHGAGSALTELGAEQGRIHLRHLASATRKAAGALSHDFNDSPITLGSQAALPLGYQAGCALSRTWAAGDITQATVTSDLSRMLDMYRILAGSQET